MNCKPGDLAVVVGSDGCGIAREISKAMIGRIVRLVRLRPPMYVHCLAELVWEFDVPQKVVLRGKSYVAYGIADPYVRPLRDPGDDAKDEMLRPLPKEIAA